MSALEGLAQYRARELRLKFLLHCSEWLGREAAKQSPNTGFYDDPQMGL